MPRNVVVFIDDYLSHEAEYNAEARRQRYLRTRQLKGRQPAAAPVKGSQSKTLVTKTAPQRQAEMKARVDKLTKRLEKLRSVLRDLVAESKQGKSSTKESPSTSKGSKAGTGEKRSAAEKVKDAKRAKEYREDHKKPSDSKKTEDIEAKIKDIREKIAKMKSEIAAARRKSGSKELQLAGSVGAGSTNSK